MALIEPISTKRVDDAATQRHQLIRNFDRISDELVRTRVLLLLAKLADDEASERAEGQQAN
jgi:hypothetical protein